MGHIYSELKRRNIFKVALAYVLVAWLLIQLINDFAVPIGLPVWAPAFFIVIIGACFPIALLLSWAYEITPEGMKRSNLVSGAKSITRKTGRTIDKIIIVALLLAIIHFVMERQGYFNPAVEQDTATPAATVP